MDQLVPDWFRRNLLGRRLALSADRSSPEVAAGAALLAGEPRRALRLLPADGGGTPRGAALVNLANAMEINWFPGDTGALLEAPLSEAHAVPSTGSDVDDLRLWFVGNFPGELFTTRDIARQLVGSPQQRSALLAEITSGWSDFVQLAQPLDPRIAATLLLELADVYRLGGDPTSGGFLEQAESLADQLADDALKVRCDLIRGDGLLTPRSSPDSLGYDLAELARGPGMDAASAAAAEPSYTRAQARLDAVGAPRADAVIRQRLGLVAQLRSDLPGAVQAYATAAEIARAAGDEAFAQLVDLHRLIAVVEAGELSAADQASGDQLVSWATSVGSRSFAAGCARVIHAVGRDWLRRGDVERARVMLTLAQQLSSRLVPVFEQQQVVEDLADLYRYLYNPGPAVGLVKQLLRRGLAGRDGSDEDRPWPALTWMRLAGLAARYLLLDYPSIEQSELDDVEFYSQALLRHCPLETSQDDAADAIARLSRVELLDRLTALRSTPAATERSSEYERLAVAISLADLRLTLRQAERMRHRRERRELRRRGQVQEADRLLAQALQEATELGAAGRQDAIQLLVEAHRHGEAAAQVELLIDETPGLDPDVLADWWILVRDFTRAKAVLDSLPVAGPPDTFADLARRTRVAYALGSLESARQICADAMQDVELRIQALSRDAFRVSATDDEQTHELFSLASRLAWESGSADEAFTLADRLRSFPLGVLLDDRALGAGRAPVERLAVLGWLQATAVWTGAYDLLSAGESILRPAAERSNARRLDRAQRRLEAAEADLEQHLPGHLVARRAELPRTSMDAVRRQLPESALFVEYLVHGEGIDIWLIDERSADRISVSVSSRDLIPQVEQFFGYCAGQSEPSAGRASAAQLSVWLLDPIADPIRRHGRLILAPSGPLHRIPFAALPFGSDRLITDHDVSAVPSAAALAYLAGREQVDLTRGALVVGQPAFAPDRGLALLLGAEVEARCVAGHFGCEALAGPKATRRAVRRGMEQAAVVHLATHGLISDVAPTTSAVALAGRTSLSVSDLAGLSIDVDLVTLSACDTGRGRIIRGGEVVGLTRGLLAAGARNAIVSLWPVDDLVTCVLMEDFAARLAAGTAVSTALRDAQGAVAAMSAEERSARFGELAGGSVSADQTGSVRSARGWPVSESWLSDDHPYWWAAFMHIGG